jgi:5-(carboxyamino)imidazole ribonucleotide synthase
MMHKTIGIAGGGQLGRMLAEAGKKLGLETIVLDPHPNAPAAQVTKQIVGDFSHYESLVQFAEHVDALTFEIERANADALKAIAASGKAVHPTPDTLEIIKDKLKQKTFLQQQGIPVAPFVAIEGEDGMRKAADALGYPFILKTRFGGYDGRGNKTIENDSDAEAAVVAYSGIPLYAEKNIAFDKELAILAARTEAGELAVYPLVETVHKNHICHMVCAPAPVSSLVFEKAGRVAKEVLGALEGAGVFAIELFLVGEDILVNEIAPRVHNSGHFTIEGCETSQFEQHMRAVAGLPLGGVEMKVPAAVMINLLGERNGPADPQGVHEAEHIPGVKVHIYGKLETRVGRKMGHLTAVAASLREAKDAAEAAHKKITI